MKKENLVSIILAFCLFYFVNRGGAALGVFLGFLVIVSVYCAYILEKKGSSPETLGGEFIILWNLGFSIFAATCLVWLRELPNGLFVSQVLMASVVGTFVGNSFFEKQLKKREISPLVFIFGGILFSIAGVGIIAFWRFYPNPHLHHVSDILLVGTFLSLSTQAGKYLVSFFEWCDGATPAPLSLFNENSLLGRIVGLWTTIIFASASVYFLPLGG